MSHAYATDSSERRLVPVYLAVAAVASAFCLFAILGKRKVQFPWVAPRPIDTMALYGLYYLVFDRLLWRLRIARYIGLTRLPNLSGEWKGHVEPVPTIGVSAGLGATAEIAVSIRQTWSELLVSAQTN